MRPRFLHYSVVAWVVLGTWRAPLAQARLETPEPEVRASPPASLVLVMTAAAAEDSPRGLRMRKIFTEAFRRVGATLQYLSVPSRRATELARQGQSDGELSRVAGYAEVVPDLIRVEEPWDQAHFAAYTRDKSLKVSGWHSLAARGLRIDYRRGLIALELGVKTHLTGEKISPLTSDEQGLLRLVEGRSDIFIGPALEVAPRLDDDRFAAAKIRCAGTVADEPVHMFLHRRHARLAAPLAAALRAMRQEGRLDP